MSAPSDDSPPPSSSSRAVSLTTTKLPQFATPDEAAAREAQLQKLRSIYVYESPPSLPGASFIKGPFTDLPDEAPSLAYRLKIGLTSSRLLFNNIFASNKLSLPSALYVALSTMADAILVNPNDLSALQAALKRVRARLYDVEKLAVKAHEHRAKNPAKRTLSLIQSRGYDSSFEELAKVLEPYRSQFAVYVKPPITDVFMEDRVFARLRTAGFNPMTLRKVNSMQHLPFWVDDVYLPHNKLLDDACDSDSDHDMKSGSRTHKHMSIQDAVSNGLVYFIDLSFVKMFNPSSPKSPIPHPAKNVKHYIPAKAIFAQCEHGGELHPVGAEINGDVVYPTANDARWELAKMALNTCDAVHHELISHLGRTHLLIEPFVAATNRQLSKCHPLYKLLMPHFEGTAFINDTASRDLVTPNGDIDRIFAGDISFIMKWTSEQIRSFHFNDLFPEHDMKERNLLTTDTNGNRTLPFAYRDDCLAHYKALRKWVSSYVNYYYQGKDEHVQDDNELQKWCAELTDEDGGKIKGFGDNKSGAIVTVSYLIECITFIIFSASIQHAAVNFPQKDLMSYAPAVSGAQYADVPSDSKTPFSAHDWEEMLTPPQTAIEQLDILTLLGDTYYTQLGKYKWNQFCDDEHRFWWPQPITDAHRQYMNDLTDVDRAIVQREKDERLKYHYMRPKNIPQSINI